MCNCNSPPMMINVSSAKISNVELHFDFLFLFYLYGLEDRFNRWGGAKVDCVSSISLKNLVIFIFRLDIYSSNSFKSIDLDWFRNWNDFCLKIIYGQQLVTSCTAKKHQTIGLAFFLEATLVNFSIRLNLQEALIGHTFPHTFPNTHTQNNT